MKQMNKGTKKIWGYEKQIWGMNLFQRRNKFDFFENCKFRILGYEIFYCFSLMFIQIQWYYRETQGACGVLVYGVRAGVEPQSPCLRKNSRYTSPTWPGPSPSRTLPRPQASYLTSYLNTSILTHLILPRGRTQKKTSQEFFSFYVIKALSLSLF